MGRKLWRTLGVSAVLAGLLAAPAQSEPSHFYGSIYSYKNREPCTKPHRIDPVGVLFHGTAATLHNVGSSGVSAHRGNLERHMRKLDGRGWGDNTGGSEPQKYESFGSCNPHTAELTTPFWSIGSGAERRFHIRLWQQVQCPDGRCQVAGTPHVDEKTSQCPRHHNPASVKLPYGGRGTGFDWAREHVKAAYYGQPRYAVRDAYWGNVRTVYYCGGGGKTHSQGYATIVKVGNP